MPLSSLYVQAGAVEASCQAIWQEWLLSFFDGGLHTVNGVSALFPAVTGVRFGIPALATGGVTDNVIWISVFSELLRSREFLADEDLSIEDLITEDTAARETEEGVERATEGGVGPVKDLVDALGWRLVVQASVVRSAVSGANAGNADYLCRRVGDLLRGLVQDPSSSVLLAQKGIMNVRVMGDALVPNVHFATREVRLKGDLLYPVGS